MGLLKSYSRHVAVTTVPKRAASAWANVLIRERQTEGVRLDS